MSAITTHVLDTTTGKPGAGINVTLERKTHSSGWQEIAQGSTDVDGRIKDLLPMNHAFLTGHYRLTFEVGPHFLMSDHQPFFPQIVIAFSVRDAQQHYHVPLLVSPNGFTTYRGS